MPIRPLTALLLAATAPLAPLAVLAAGRAAPPRPAAAPATTRAELERRFAGTVQPFVHTYCATCHGRTGAQAQLDLTTYASVETVARNEANWTLVLDKLVARQMPPAGAAKQPSAAQRQSVIAWIRDMRRYELERSAGDPGVVLPRRLSNAEYDYTIRDLTGVDLQPAREFPVDPADQEGFDNSGESLTISPALLKKYYQAARDVADHAVLGADGIEFASHPVLAETDRDKYCILRIVDFYKRQPTDLADYFEAAWHYRYRAALGPPNATIASTAAAAKVSPRYLQTVWDALTAPGQTVGPMATLQARFSALPAPNRTNRDAVRTGCVALRDWVLSLRKRLAWHFDNLRLPPGFYAGGQAFVLWKDREYASHRRMLDPSRLQPGGQPGTRIVRVRGANGRRGTSKTVSDAVDADQFVPQDPAAHAPYVASFERFCSVFPDAFYVSERGRMFVDEPGDQGRLLSAGFHNSMGYFRDDQPLMELVLDDAGRRELDRLWREFDMVAFIPERMHIEFFHYERAESGTIAGPEFDFARAEDKDATSDAQIRKLGDAYLAKARRSLQANGGDPATLLAIQEHFARTSAAIRTAERERLAAEPAQLRSLLEFARHAYRRPLTDTERAGLLAFYQSLRQKEGLSHEDAIRDTLVSVLMSPDFLFLDLDAPGAPASAARAQAASAARAHAVSARSAVPQTAPGGRSVQALPDYTLASRLSYFLWSSMPDEELLAHAAAGDLRRPDVLLAQERRMLRDPRVRALAVEFGGNWLDFRHFEQNNTVDRQRFPTFDDKLRESMFEEPVRFLTDQMQRNGCALDMLYGRYTFVNAPLARHYGIAGVKSSNGEWVRVEDADRYGRGGLLPMAVFLTQNSPGLRTSPVKRGFWLVHRVLGETIPPPPPTVPALPADESQLGDRTLRQVLEQHRSNPACAGCHARFDSYGLVFEGYGPTGERRTRDLGGKLVDDRAPFAGGERKGVSGVEAFVRERRQADFIGNLCRKLLSYALGRSLQPSDDNLLHTMQTKLVASGYRFDTLIDCIVTSPQFRFRRAPDLMARS